jgi:uncharacterized DUF497 family protein
VCVTATKADCAANTASMFLFEDTRCNYGDQRMIGMGLLSELVVLVAHVESDDCIHVISMRKADSDEIDLYYQEAGYF